MNRDFITFSFEHHVGGPQPTVGRGFPPKLDVLSSSGKGQLAKTPALESLFVLKFSFYVLYPCSVFLLVQGVDLLSSSLFTMLTHKEFIWLVTK